MFYIYLNIVKVGTFPPNVDFYATLVVIVIFIKIDPEIDIVAKIVVVPLTASVRTDFSFFGEGLQFFFKFNIRHQFSFQLFSSVIENFLIR